MWETLRVKIHHYKTCTWFIQASLCSTLYQTKCSYYILSLCTKMGKDVGDSPGDSQVFTLTVDYFCLWFVFFHIETSRHGGEKNREDRSVHEDVRRRGPPSAAHRGEVFRRHDESRRIHRAQECEYMQHKLRVCRHTPPRGAFQSLRWGVSHSTHSRGRLLKRRTAHL